MVSSVQKQYYDDDDAWNALDLEQKAIQSTLFSYDAIFCVF